MSNRLRGWFRRKTELLRSRSQNKNPTEDPNVLPQLPVQRAFALTPSPSREHLLASSASSPFFRLLPMEVRRLVLIEAFGDRTVHVDFVFDHPVLYLSDEGARRGGSHCGIDVGSDYWRKRDTTKPKAWRWFSCVCHRDFEWCVRGEGLISEPYDDTCLAGTAGCCRGWPGVMPDKCFVGVMGWLLACRQAYVEGISVIYSTNNFHISNSDMIHTLPNLIRAKHREMITSVEMVLQFKPDSRESGLSDFNALLQGVPDAFPRLRNLYIYPVDIWKFPGLNPDDHGTELVTEILELVDAMVRRLGPQLRVCDIAIPFRKFHSQWVSGIEKGYKYEHSGCTRLSRRIGRPLAPLQQDNEGEQLVESGYWIREGPDDTPYPFAHMVPV
ncbi:hypothetical protein F4781DRAFT_427548 [Annulohypoxylon bovei var. microspora]|nr:hypothetical protein F4781DRAFT_427548 [Annulohypoxylon bovei var. microspora]